ncbi:hypothetical protein E4V51_25260, partial [Paenibacillus sp. 28ISP30-2]|nr:hypothetical protein [Paenibacillus sp. 28ISP30-2]
MIKESRMTTTNEPSDLWMTRFLRESEPQKRHLIREARKNNDIPLINRDGKATRLNSLHFPKLAFLFFACTKKTG